MLRHQVFVTLLGKDYSWDLGRRSLCPLFCFWQVYASAYRLCLHPDLERWT